MRPTIGPLVCLLGRRIQHVFETNGIMTFVMDLSNNPTPISLSDLRYIEDQICPFAMMIELTLSPLDLTRRLLNSQTVDTVPDMVQSKYDEYLAMSEPVFDYFAATDRIATVENGPLHEVAYNLCNLVLMSACREVAERLTGGFISTQDNGEQGLD